MKERKEFVLSELMEAKESGFYIMNPDFDELEREMFDEEIQLAEKLAEFGIEWEVSQQEEIPLDELNKKNKERFLADPFCKENIDGVFLEEDSVTIKFTNPGYGVRWAKFSIEEVQDLPLELQERMFRKNPYLFPYVDQCLVNIDEVRFLKSKEEKVFVKFILSSEQEVVYALEDNREILKFIKEKFDLSSIIEERCQEFREKSQKFREINLYRKEVRKAIESALRIYKKETNLSDWFQYVVKYSERIIYIFKPRLWRSDEVFYSVFKVIKGDPQMRIPDRVEPLFAVSTDRFLKEWEDILERN